MLKCQQLLALPTVVGILTFMSRINYLLRRVEHGKSFITLLLVLYISSGVWTQGHWLIKHEYETGPCQELITLVKNNGHDVKSYN